MQGNFTVIPLLSDTVSTKMGHNFLFPVSRSLNFPFSDHFTTVSTLSSLWNLRPPRSVNRHGVLTVIINKSLQHTHNLYTLGCKWRMCSGTWRCVDLELTDVSEERIASIFRVEKSASEEPPSAGRCGFFYPEDGGEAIRSSETSILARCTQHHIPEDDILHSHSCESLKSYLGHKVTHIVNLLIAPCTKVECRSKGS
jgi:hypothetical protein